MTDDNEFMTAALGYAAQGLHVFPVKPKAKAPLTKNGFKDASIDTAKIIEWWTQWPDANIGIATGKVSGLFVVDIDGEYPSDWPSLPPATVVKTGRGFHHYYEYPQGQDIPSKTKLNKQSVDIQSDGKYVVAPPSIHPTGGRYEFIA